MKLRGLLTLLVGALLLGVGCTTDADINTSGAGSEGKIKTVKITATLPELGGTTRAEDSAKGGITNVDWTKYELRVIIKAYGAEGDKFAGQYATEVVDYKYQTDIENGNISVDVGLPLTTGHRFDIYLWADYVLKSAPTADLHYNTAGFPAITLAGENPTLVINDESYDAFFGKGTVNVGEIATTWDTDFSVQRAVAKLRMIATDAASATATHATLETEKFYTGFDIATGVTTLSHNTPTLSARTAFETYSTETAPETKSFITAYLLWPAVDEGGNATTSTIAANFYEGDNTDPVSTIAPTMAIPLKRGWLTTLRGEMFESGWDGTTLVEPMTIDGEWLVLNNTEELAWVLQNGNTKGKSKVRITCNMDMGGNTVKPFPAWVSEFDGASHKISNFAIDGDALFTPNTDANYINEINIHDLNIEGATIENSGHVGVLVNRVGINATFQNITIKNSSATTSNGAAGGVVGYIGGGTGLALEVKFINCDLENVKSSGTLDEGIFVGRMHGYNDDEILSFDADCSADANCAVTDFKSPYTEDNDAQWLDEGDSAFDFTKYNGWLGDEEIYRGVIKFEDRRMQIKWDGKTKVEPLTEDGSTSIYSPFDLAYLQQTVVRSGTYPHTYTWSNRINHNSVTFKSDVDLGGVCENCRNNNCICTKAGKGTCDCTECRKFTPIYSIKTLEGNNHTVYNLHVDMIHDGDHGAGFMQTTVDGSNHRNLNLVGANIKTDHDRNIPICTYGQKDNGSGNAYAGTFVAATGSGTYTLSNIHVSSGKVSGVCKIGGLIGRATCATLNMSNCTVDNYIVENYEANRPNYYPIEMSKKVIFNTYAVTCLGWWYTQGECGGLIGFVQCSQKADIINCSVTNTQLNCFGQENKTVVANVIRSSRYTGIKEDSDDQITAQGTTLIAGRHVNQFIGDVVSARKSDSDTNTYVVNIKNYNVSNNSYNGVLASSTNKYNHEYKNGSYCDAVGCAYYVGVEADFVIFDLHVKDYAGTLTFNKTGESEITITENKDQANGISWIGGNFNLNLTGNQRRYPEAPTNIGE